LDLALFDFDGTITTHETMPAFVRATAGRPRLVAGYLLLWPVILGYKLGLVSGSRVRAAIVRVAYAGRSAAWLRTRGEAFARDYLDRHLRPEAMRRIAWHRARGDALMIVSGGLAAFAGVPGAQWLLGDGMPLSCELSIDQGFLASLAAWTVCGSA
jgi:phosphoserine phosphatase